MNEIQKATAKTCLEAAEKNSMAFPEIVGALIGAGFESYMIDFRRSAATYFLPNGDFIELGTHKVATAIASRLDTAQLQAAIREAQQQIAGYTYKMFCEKAASAGCASYIVSFSGRCVLYIGRTAETHSEHFPN